MSKQKFDINKIRVASPCSVGWETMSGDERVRHCQSCRLNVYNVSAMTEKEVENLLTKREDRVCIRLYKRADGTILTKDCPIGLRKLQKRAARFAGATLAAILGLFSVSFGQKEDKHSDTKTDAGNQIQKNILSGVIKDSNGAVIPKAELKLYKEKDKNPLKTKSDEDGKYLFKNLSAGKYKLEVKYKGFTTQIYENVEIKNDGEIKINVELFPSQGEVTVGIFAEEPLIDGNSSSITTKFSRKQIQSLPF